MGLLKQRDTPEALKPENRRKFVRGEFITPYDPPTAVYDPKKVIHMVWGTGCRCAGRREYPNATTVMGDVTCKGCLRHILHGLKRNISHYQNYVDSGRVPPAYADKGITLEDLHEALRTRKARLVEFQALMENR